MTCKDCIHLQQNTCEHYHIEVDADTYRICADMVSKDGTYHNGTYHCPRCGRPVSKWGLCMDCEILYGGWKQEVFDEYGNYKYSSDIILDKPNNATSCVENALDALDSWESVSK